jgi:hypothetical protein
MTNDISALFRQLDELVNAGGYRDDDAMRHVRALTFSLCNDHRLSAAARSKVSGVAGYFEILYSERRHRDWPRGAESVRDFIRVDLSAARSQPLVDATRR